MALMLPRLSWAPADLSCVRLFPIDLVWCLGMSWHVYTLPPPARMQQHNSMCATGMCGRARACVCCEVTWQ